MNGATNQLQCRLSYAKSKRTNDEIWNVFDTPLEALPAQIRATMERTARILNAHGGNESFLRLNRKWRIATESTDSSCLGKDVIAYREGNEPNQKHDATL